MLSSLLGSLNRCLDFLPSFLNIPCPQPFPPAHRPLPSLIVPLYLNAEVELCHELRVELELRVCFGGERERFIHISRVSVSFSSSRQKHKRAWVSLKLKCLYARIRMCCLKVLAYETIGSSYSLPPEYSEAAAAAGSLSPHAVCRRVD